MSVHLNLPLETVWRTPQRMLENLGHVHTRHRAKMSGKTYTRAMTGREVERKQEALTTLRAAGVA